MEHIHDQSGHAANNMDDNMRDLYAFMTFIFHIFMSMEFMKMEFSELLGFSLPSQDLPMMPLAWDDIDEDEQSLSTYLSWSNMQNLVTHHFYHPHARPSSGMWVKHRSRGWFLDFMLEYDDERWLQNFKMSSGAFNWLCNVLAPTVTRMDTNYRHALFVPERVGALLYKLLWAASSAEITEAFGIGQSTLYDLLRQVVPAILETLGHYISWPAGEVLQATIAENLERSGIPNVIGALDCTHVRIPAPTGSIKYDYFNRKAYYSIAMQAVVDSKAKFIDVHIGKPGSMNDSRVLRISPLYEPASHGTLLKGLLLTLPSGFPVPPILLADYVYPALPWLVPSFKKDPRIAHLSFAKKVFNNKLSKSRVYSEIAFRRMKRTFREVGWKSDLDIRFLPQDVHACCILYNILVDIKEIDFESVFSEMQARSTLLRCDQETGRHERVVDRSTIDSSVLRDHLFEYVINQ